MPDASPATVTLITPVASPHARFLPALYASLGRQRPAWRWAVEVDDEGGAEAVFEALEACGALADVRVAVQHTGRRLGTPTARNVAFAWSQPTPFVLPVDADDFLEEDGLGALVEGLQAHPEAGWCAPRRWRVVGETEETIERREGRLAAGVAAAGAVRACLDGGGNPSPPNLVGYRREAVLEAGGWPACPPEEDLNLWAAVSDVRPGVVVDVRAVASRRWAGQATAHPERLTPLFEAARFWRSARVGRPEPLSTD